MRPFVSCLLLLATAAPNLARADHHEKKTGGNKSWVTSIARIGDSDQFAAATATGLLLREAAVTTFHGSDPTTLTPIYTHPAAVWCVVATSDGKQLASVDYRGNLVTYDTASKKATTHEKALERWCQALVVSPDNQHLVAGNEAGKVIVWNLAESKAGATAELDGHAVTGISFSPDASQIALSDGGGHIHLLKWPSLESIGKIDVSKETVWCVAYTDGGSKLLAGSSDRQLYRVDAKPESKAESIANGTDWITQLAVSSSGQVAAAEVGGRLHFPAGGGTDSMKADSGIWSLCWNGDGQLLAGTRKDGIVMAGRSWKWTEPKKPEPKPAESQPAEEKSEAPKAEEKPADKPEEKPKEEPKAEAKQENKPAENKPAEETPANNKTDSEPKKDE